MNKNNGITMYCYPGFFFFYLKCQSTQSCMDTEHPDTKQFKNNIVRTTDENIPTGSCSKWGLAPNTHNYSKEKNFPKIKGL